MRRYPRAQNRNSPLQRLALCPEPTGRPIPREIAGRRAGDPATLVASSAKAVLGWNPTRYSLEEIIESAYRWHLNHPNGFGE